MEETIFLLCIKKMEESLKTWELCTKNQSAGYSWLKLIIRLQTIKYRSWQPLHALVHFIKILQYKQLCSLANMFLSPKSPGDIGMSTHMPSPATVQVKFYLANLQWLHLKLSTSLFRVVPMRLANTEAAQRISMKIKIFQEE